MAVIDRLAATMYRIGFSGEEIDRQIAAFKSAVQWELDTISLYENQRPGPGAA